MTLKQQIKRAYFKAEQLSMDILRSNKPKAKQPRRNGVYAHRPRPRTRSMANKVHAAQA
jgi:hypothetical protein